MTYEEFVLRNQRIGESLDAIANRTENMAWVGKALSDNPDFVELMAQDFLLASAGRLLETIIGLPKA